MPDADKDTKTHRGVTYRLLPGSKANGYKLSGLAGACRFVWNAILAQINEEYDAVKDTDEKNPSVSFFSLGQRFTALRQETPWLPDYSFAIVRYGLKYQADAWSGFFKVQRSHPQFHSKYGSTPSFTIPDNVKIKDGTLYVPKVGWMRLRRKGGNPYPDGTPKQATVKKEGRYWNVSVNYEIDAPGYTDNGVAVGVDLNTYNVAWTDTEGECGMLAIPKLTKSEIRIRRYQRKLARQQKGSNRRRGTKRKIAKWKRTQKNQRKNRDHHNSRILANQAEVLVREDLKLKNMTKSAKGSVENPGTNVNAKAGLNRVMLNASHGRFTTYCDYKFKTVITVDPKYTSQACNACGCIDKTNRPSQSRFKCVSCGHADHADLNASANILASGIGASGRGEAFPLGTSMIRQMDTRVAA
ncbi:MAG: transposase [Bacteroidota bacterium]|nr:transposase [Bacteroidota bacterium]